MGILRVDHPDIMEFIHCKTNNKEITNFNISVGLTEKFMNAVEAGKDYELVDPHGGRVTGTLNARRYSNASWMRPGTTASLELFFWIA